MKYTVEQVAKLVENELGINFYTLKISKKWFDANVLREGYTDAPDTLAFFIALADIINTKNIEIYFHRDLAAPHISPKDRPEEKDSFYHYKSRFVIFAYKNDPYIEDEDNTSFSEESLSIIESDTDGAKSVEDLSAE